MKRPDKTCAKCGVTIPGNYRYCPAHYETTAIENYERRKNKKADAVYLSKEQRAANKYYLSKNPFCECGARAVLVHHIIPIKRGGSALALDNMEGKCWSCHSRHHARDGWGRGQRYESNSRW